MNPKMQDAVRLVANLKNYAVFGSVAAHAYVGASYSLDLDVYFPGEQALKDAVNKAKNKGAKIKEFGENYVRLDYKGVSLDFYLKEKSIHWDDRQEKKFDNYKIELISPEDLIITKVRVTNVQDRPERKKERDKKSIIALAALTSLGRVIQKTPNTKEAFSIMDYFHRQIGIA